MSRNKKTWLWGALVALCLAFIWGNSLLSAEISSEVSGTLGQLLGLIFGRWSETAETILRKLAHFTEFALLGCSLFGLLRLWVQKPGLTALFCGLLVAMVDETIQVFVSGRASMVMDVWIDFGGVLCGVLVMALVTGKAGKTPRDHSKAS